MMLIKIRFHHFSWASELNLLKETCWASFVIVSSWYFCRTARLQLNYKRIQEVHKHLCMNTRLFDVERSLFRFFSVFHFRSLSLQPVDFIYIFHSKHILLKPKFLAKFIKRERKFAHLWTFSRKFHVFCLNVELLFSLQLNYFILFHGKMVCKSRILNWMRYLGITQPISGPRSLNWIIFLFSILMALIEVYRRHHKNIL